MNGLMSTYREVLRSYYGQVKERTERHYLFYRYVYRPLSFPLSAIAIRSGASADGVTLANLVLLIAAMVAVAWGTRGAMLAGAVLFFAYFVLDFVDGNIARYFRVSSYFGKLIDGMVDTLSFILFSAVALGNARVGASLYGAELEIALGVATTVSAFIRQNYRWRLAYLRSEMGLTIMADAQRAKPDSTSREHRVPLLVWLFDNAATSTPIVLLAAACADLVSLFVLLFFLLYAIGGNLETLLSIVKNRSTLLDRRDH
jgi:phosphatidylglycerophosphate synthase